MLSKALQVDVRQQRADTTALNGSYLTLYALAFFQHACLEPFLDQTHNAPIGYAVLDKLHQPSLVESVVKLSDVGIEYPVHFSCSDPNRQRIQRFVWATLWSETVRESQKVLLPGRAVARTGLRMTPTFPPLPLTRRSRNQTGVARCPRSALSSQKISTILLVVGAAT